MFLVKHILNPGKIEILFLPNIVKCINKVISDTTWEDFGEKMKLYMRVRKWERKHKK